MIDNANWPPGMVIFPKNAIELFDKPGSDEILATVSIGKKPWQLEIVSGSETTIVSDKELKEIEYEIAAPIVFRHENGFINVFRHYKPSGVWINLKSLDDSGYPNLWYHTRGC